MMSATESMQVTIAAHAHLRLHERVAEFGLTMSDVQTIVRRIPRKQAQSCAVCVQRIGKQINAAWGEASNGDEVWIVVRCGQVRTVMLRRSTQPKTPEAFNVQYVYA